MLWWLAAPLGERSRRHWGSSRGRPLGLPHWLLLLLLLLVLVPALLRKWGALQDLDTPCASISGAALLEPQDCSQNHE